MTFNQEEFCYSFHLDGSDKKVTIGQLRQLLAILDALSLSNETEFEECLLSMYIRYDQYPTVSKTGHIVLPPHSE